MVKWAGPNETHLEPVSSIPCPFAQVETHVEPMRTCWLGTNELPLRHLIVEFDGKSLSNSKWSGEFYRAEHK